MRPYLPRFLMGLRCWRQLCRELDRVAPAEGLAVPLLSIELRGGRAHPLQDMHLDQIKRVCIPRIFLLPAHLQRNRAARVNALAGADDLLQDRIESCLDLYPRLRPAGFIHSHPFARLHTWPSAVDLEGHLLPLLRRNRSSGLDTSFSLIACRKGAGRAWRLQAFGLDAQRRVVDCGTVRPVPEFHPALRQALRGHAMQRQAGIFLLEPWLEQLRSVDLRPQVQGLLDGWLRCDVFRDQRRVLAVLLPPDFPERAPLVYAHTDPGWRELARRLPEPEGLEEVA